MKKLMVVVLMAGALAVQSQADSLIQVSAGNLQDSGGNLAPQTSIAVLVVDHGNTGFTDELTLQADFALSVGALWGDDRVLAVWDLGAPGQDGLLVNSVSLLTAQYPGTVALDDRLQLYWFPTLTTAATQLGFSTEYGKYTDQNGIDGSAIWKIPADGTQLHDLKFLTQTQGGTPLETAGRASLTTEAIPEPSTVVLVGLSLLSMFGLARRR